MFKKFTISMFLLGIALSFSVWQSSYCQEAQSKSTLLTGIKNLNLSIFSRAPLFKYPIKDRALLDELFADIAIYTSKNSQQDRTIISAMGTIAKETENIIKTSEYLYTAQQAAVRNLPLERALFAGYAQAIKKLKDAQTQLKKETYFASGKRSSREILIALLDTLIKTTEKAYKSYEDQEAQADKMSKDKDYVITFFSAAQGKVFDFFRVFKTPKDAGERNEKMQAYAQWNEAVRLVEKYIAFTNKPVSKEINAYLAALKQLADQLINTTKFINTSVFARENTITGSLNDRELVNDYADIDKEAKAIGTKLRAPEFAKTANLRNCRDVLSASALIIEATAEKLPSAFKSEITKRTK